MLGKSQKKKSIPLQLLSAALKYLVWFSLVLLFHCS